MSWIYEQFTGRLIDPSGKCAGVGYSGHPPHVNDPDAERIANFGPLPRGSYTILFPRDTNSHGPFVLPLSPYAGNDMFGRSEFLIHGDEVAHPGEREASRGCIILPRELREAIWNSGDHRIQVVRGTQDATGTTD